LATRADINADIEQSQLVIRIEDAKVNYSKVIPVIEFKPYMLDLPPPVNGLSSGGIRLAVYLPDTHNVPYIFGKYLQLYKQTIGNPALVFVDKKAYADYMQYARETVKKEKEKSAPNFTMGPHQVIDDDKVRMMNNNISFIVKTLFAKNRIITTGERKDRIQTALAGKPVVVAQSYYMESYDMTEVSYAASGSLKKYTLGDTVIFEKEQLASELKDKIDEKRVELKTKEKAWVDAKAAYATALKAIPPPPPSASSMTALVTSINQAKEEYNDVNIAEKELLAERTKIVADINRYRYGKENPKVDEILNKISRLNESKQKTTRDKTGKQKQLELEKTKKSKMEERVSELSRQIKDEYVRILRSVFNETNTIADLAETTLESRIQEIRDTLTGHATATAVGISRDVDINALKHKKMLYDEAKKYIDKLKDEKERIEGSRLSSSSLSFNRSSSDMRSVKSAIKKLEEEIREIDDKLVLFDAEINAEKMKLEEYTLRVYVYSLKGAELVSKYRNDGKKNPQFTLLEKKGYADVLQSSEYQKNAKAMMKDAPMFSQASCLQKKTDIQKMFENIMFDTKEKIKDAIYDVQDGGGGDDKDKKKKKKTRPDRVKAAKSKIAKPVEQETASTSSPPPLPTLTPQKRLGVVIKKPSKMVKVLTNLRTRIPSVRKSIKTDTTAKEAAAEDNEAAELKAAAEDNEAAELKAAAALKAAEEAKKAAAEEAKKAADLKAAAAAAAELKAAEEANAAAAAAELTAAAARVGPVPDLASESLTDKAKQMVSDLKENYSKFSLIGMIKTPGEPINGKYLLNNDEQRDNVKCEATILKKTEAEENRAKLYRIASTPMGKYPSFLMPQGFYDMHQLVYRPPTITDVRLDCAEPADIKKDIVIKNIEKLLYRSNIPSTFPQLSTSKEATDYKDSIEMEQPFVNAGMSTPLP
jgi:hypothetical protein